MTRLHGYAFRLKVGSQNRQALMALSDDEKRLQNQIIAKKNTDCRMQYAINLEKKEILNLEHNKRN